MFKFEKKKICKNNQHSARVLFKTQRSFSVPTTKDPKNSSGIDEHQVFNMDLVIL